MKSIRILACFAAVYLVTKAVEAKDRTPAAVQSEQVVLIIRHAEKPVRGSGLSSDGERRAAGYVQFFKEYSVDGKPITLGHLYAAADTRQSRRSRLTLQPLAHALRMPIDTRFADAATAKLATDIRKKHPTQNIVVSWHHTEIPNLIEALGADPESLLPNGEWPDSEFGWVVELRFWGGELVGSQVIEEDMP